jgi:hypothetical protein
MYIITWYPHLVDEIPMFVAFQIPSCCEIEDSPSAGPKSGGLWWKMLDLAPAETTPETVSSNLAGKSENQMGDFPTSHIIEYQRGRRY